MKINMHIYFFGGVTEGVYIKLFSFSRAAALPHFIVAM